MTQQNALYVFTHIPKTAGSYLKLNISRSHPLGYSLEAVHQGNFTNIHSGKIDCYRNKEHYKEYIDSLTIPQKDKIGFIAGHNAYYGIHEIFDRPAKYFTFVREPISRVISFYNFFKTCWERDINVKNPTVLQKLFLDRLRNHFLIDGKVPDFETWFQTNFIDGKNPYTESMCDFLERLHFMSDKRDESALQEALNKFYFVGLTETFNIDASFLYHLFNVRSCKGNENASKQYIKRNMLSGNLINRIKDVSRDDVVLYECALRENALFKKNTQDFYVKVSETNRRRRCHFAMEWTKKNLKDMLRPWFKPLLEMYRSRR